MKIRRRSIPELTDQQLRNFKSKITFSDDSCWQWNASVNLSGYGNVRINKKTWLATRISYFIFKGNPGQLNVLHSCDKPLCVNPDHLWLGTQYDNMQDCSKKGRHAYSNRTHCKKGHALTKETISNNKRRKTKCKICHKLYCREWRRARAKNI